MRIKTAAKPFLALFLILSISLSMLPAVIPATAAPEPTAGTSGEIVALAVSDSFYSDLILTPGTNMSELRFTWYTAQATGKLAYRVQGAGDFTFVDTTVATSASSTKSGTARNSPDTGHTRIHKAAATGLLPSTTYEYKLIDSNNDESTTYTVKTGDPNNFRFYAVTDAQIGSSSTLNDGPANDAAGWNRTIGAAVNNFQNGSFIISLGDQVETPTDQVEYHSFIQAPVLKNLPLAPTVGNHEVFTNQPRTEYGTLGQLFIDHYNLPNWQLHGVTTGGIQDPNGPATTRGDYWWRYGNALFYVLDTTPSSSTARLNRFREVMANNSDAKWKFVMFHQALYSVYRSTSDWSKTGLISGGWVTEFDNAGIDVVFSGHDHVYSRSYPMRGNATQKNQVYLDSAGLKKSDSTGLLYRSVLNPTATMYFTLSTSSGSKYYPASSVPASVATYSQPNIPCFAYIDITDKSFSFATYSVSASSAMTLIDDFTIVKDSDYQEPGAHTVTFDTDGGSAIAPVSVLDGGKATQPPNPTKRGFTFVRWEMGGLPYDFESPVTGPIVLKAVWDVSSVIAESYPISNWGDSYWRYARSNAAFMTDSFNLGITSGWTLSPNAVGIGSPGGLDKNGVADNSITLATTLASTATAAGAGTSTARYPWVYFKKGFTLPDDFDPESIVDASGFHRLDDALIMYVNGTEVYRYNTGSSSTYNVSIGQTFTSWSTYMAGRNSDATTREFDINSNYNNRDTGYTSTATGTPPPPLNDAASLTNLKAALRPGANVITCAVGQNSASSSDLWFDLKFDIEVEINVVESHTVTFDSAGGSAVAPVNVAEGQTVAKPADPTKAGYSFVRWELGGVPYEFNTPVTAPITLVAVWEVRTTNTFRISDWGDSYWRYARNNAAFMTDAFDLSITSGWTYSPNAVGVGQPGGIDKNGVADNSITLATTLASTATPAGAGTTSARYPWIYFKKGFSLPEDFDAETIIDASGLHRLDDALIMYVNGIEVYRYNAGSNNPYNVVIGQTFSSWATYMSGHNSDATTREFDINSNYNNRYTGYESIATGTPRPGLNDAASLTNLKAALRPGANVLTCVVGNNSASSSDLWFDLKLDIEAGATPPVEDDEWTVEPVNNTGSPSVGLTNDLVASTEMIKVSNPGFARITTTGNDWFEGANWNGIKLVSPAGYAAKGYAAGNNLFQFTLIYPNSLTANRFYVEARGFDSSGKQLVYDAQTSNAATNNSPVSGYRSQNMQFWFNAASAVGIDRIEITIRANNVAVNTPVYLSAMSFGTGTMPVASSANRNLNNVIVTEKYTNPTVLDDTKITIPTAISTADPNATSQARNLLGYMKAVANSPYVLWGEQNPDFHNDDYNWTQMRGKSPFPDNGDTALMDLIGVRQAVMGFDSFSFVGHEQMGGSNLSDRVQGSIDKSIKWAKEYNGIIHLTMHQPNYARMIDLENLQTYTGSYMSFFRKQEANYDGANGVNYSCNGMNSSDNAMRRILPGGDANRAYLEYLDMVVRYALALQEEDIAFIFRPFHELDGGFFWWGIGRSGNVVPPEVFISVWRYTFDYFMSKGVHNAIWCYGWNNNLQSVSNFARAYPGDEYVDMVSFDRYGGGTDGSTVANNYASDFQVVSNFATQYNKVAAMAEGGAYKSGNVGVGTDERTPGWHLAVLREATGRNGSTGAVRTDRTINISFFMTWDYDFYYPWMTSATRGSNGADRFISGFANENASVFADGGYSYNQIKNLNVAAGTNFAVAGYVISPETNATINAPAVIRASVRNAPGNATIEIRLNAGSQSITKPAKLNAQGYYSINYTEGTLSGSGSIQILVNGTVVGSRNVSFVTFQGEPDPDMELADYGGLDAALAIAAGYVETDYTVSSWAAVAAGGAIDRGLPIIDQGIVDAAEQAILDAIALLEPASVSYLQLAAGQQAAISVRKGYTTKIAIDTNCDIAGLAVTSAVPMFATVKMVDGEIIVTGVMAGIAVIKITDTVSGLSLNVAVNVIN